MNLADPAVSQTIPARAAQVFDVWLDPKSPGSLWHAVDRVILNLFVDGLS